jgi:uncharacterized membrane protein YhiD involved in acid resistance
VLIQLARLCHKLHDSLVLLLQGLNEPDALWVASVVGVDVGLGKLDCLVAHIHACAYESFSDHAFDHLLKHYGLRLGLLDDLLKA